MSAGSTIRGTKTSPITNFQQGDATVVPISLPMTHYVKSFNVSQEDLMSGLRVENLMQLNLLQFTKDVTLDALSPIAGAAANTQIPGPLNSSGQCDQLQRRVRSTSTQAHLAGTSVKRTVTISHPSGRT